MKEKQIKNEEVLKGPVKIKVMPPESPKTLELLQIFPDPLGFGVRGAEVSVRVIRVSLGINDAYKLVEDILEALDAVKTSG